MRQYIPKAVEANNYGDFDRPIAMIFSKLVEFWYTLYLVY